MGEIVIQGIVSIIIIIFWQKKINPDTTWIYAIYLILILILLSFLI